MESSWKKFG